MKHDAQIQIVKKLNKQGKEYSLLEVYVKGLLIQDFFIKDSLQQILEYVLSSEAPDKTK